MENKILNKGTFTVLIPIVIFSILLFFVPHKTVKAEVGNQRPLSFYGVSANSVVRVDNTVLMSKENDGKYINGVYSENATQHSTLCGSPCSGGSFGGETHDGNSISGNVIAGGSHSGSTISGNSIGGNSYSGNSYGSVSYGGNSYGGSSYGTGSYSGNTYGGSSQTAGVANAFPKCEPYLKSYLGYGRNNDPVEVKKLQEFLNKYEGEKLAVTGVFDTYTLEAVKRFQSKYSKDVLQDSWGLSCNTGYVYITTLTKINDIVCEKNTDFKNIPLPDPRPVYYCNGVKTSSTQGQAVPCTSTSTNLKATGSQVTSPVVSVNSNNVNADSKNNTVGSSQVAGVGAVAHVSILSSAKNAWKKALGH